MHGKVFKVSDQLSSNWLIGRAAPQGISTDKTALQAPCGVFGQHTIPALGLTACHMPVLRKRAKISAEPRVRRRHWAQVVLPGVAGETVVMHWVSLMKLRLAHWTSV